MSKEYRTNVHYAVIYENYTGFKIWGNYAFLAPANHNLDWHSNSGYSADINLNSKAWLWSTVNNAAYIYREKMCPHYSINKPASDLRLWTLRIKSDNWGGSAPMAKRFKMDVAKLSALIGLFYHPYGFLLNATPDIFIIKDFDNTRACYSNVFHELSHASHYEKVGKEYWQNYIGGIIANRGYGKNANNTNAGYIGVGEMWGYYFGWVCTTHYFGTTSIGGTDYWFNPIIMYNLHNKPCNLEPKQIYPCLTPDVTNHTRLKNKLISKYGKATEINAIFGKYGF